MPLAEVNGTRLWYEVAGEGPAVVLLHNGLMDARMWDGQLATFARAHQVVRYDQRFFGRSDRPEGTRYSERDDLALLLDTLGIERAALVGTSLGGRVALDFALERPERVWAMVLVAAGLGGHPLAGAYSAAQDAAFEAALEHGDEDAAVQIDLDVWGPLGATERMRELMRANLHTNLLDESSAAEALRPPAVERLGEIGVPTLVITGDRDVAVMGEIGDLLEAGIPGATRVRMVESDHFPSLRQPEEFDEVVLDFLARSLGPAARAGRRPV